MPVPNIRLLDVHPKEVRQGTYSWDVKPLGVTSDGYIQPMLAWNPDNGEKLFVGGSFSSVGGWLTRGIAQYDPAAQSWGAVGNGAYSSNTNYFVTSFAIHRFGSADELVVGGGYATASNIPNTQNLARWNGTRWDSIGGGSPSGAVWTLASWQGRLYVGGGFATIGSSSTPASGLAAWDGSAWSAVGSGMNGCFSPAVFAMKAFNDGSGEKLYVGGRFASIGGVSGLIGRWTGSAWQPVGGGVAPGDPTFSDIECMEVFNDGTGDALYVGGWTLRPFQSPNCSVAKWNGTHAHARGFSVVREYQGHGIGRSFHLDPGIPHYACQSSAKHTILPGMCFTIEPMINLGTWETELDRGDGWTVRTLDRQLSAQFEHTILMTETGPEILTTTELGPRPGEQVKESP